MFTVSSKSRSQGPTRSLRRVIGPISGIALMLMLSGGVSARQLPVDYPEIRVVDQRSFERMILMLKLNTDAGHKVLVYG
jgi:hypothetical protein